MISPMPETALIRLATPSDAPEIARVNHQTWVETYKGILDDEVIKARSLEEQVKVWQDQLGAPKPSELRFVAEAHGQIVGYVGGGRNADTHSPFQAELFGIYVVRDFQNKGLGSRLVSALAAALKEKGHGSMLVWIMEKNPYRKFYEKLGGLLLDQSRDVEYGGKNLRVACYGWADLGPLIRK